MRPYFRWGFGLGTVGVILLAAGMFVFLRYSWTYPAPFIGLVVPALGLLSASVGLMFRLASRVRQEAAEKPSGPPPR